MDDAEATYDLPRNSGEIAIVVDAIPDSWQGIEGRLIAPKRLYNVGSIAVNTCLMVKRDYDIQQKFVHTDDLPFEDEQRSRLRKEPKECCQNILLMRQLPSGVQIQDTLYRRHEKSFSAVKGLTIDLIQRGYKGLIRAMSGFYDACKSDNPETIVISDWDGKIFLSWKEQYGGKRENLLQVIYAIENTTTITLSQQLKQLIAEEKYEDAAKLRDQIKTRHRK